MMEQRLAQADWTPGETTEHVSSLSSTVQEKETVINKLETQVEEQVYHFDCQLILESKRTLLHLFTARRSRQNCSVIAWWLMTKVKALNY
jgi:hypothetical protein